MQYYIAHNTPKFNSVVFLMSISYDATTEMNELKHGNIHAT